MNDIYRFCNSITVDDMLSLLLKPENGITLDGLENAGYARIDKLRDRYSAMMEDSVWERCGDSLKALEDYVSKCNSGVLLGKHLEEAKEKLKLSYCAEEQSKWMEIQTKPSNILNLLEAFIEKSRKGYYTQHLSEALTLQKQLITSESERKEQIEFENFKSEWESICNMDDLDRMEEKIIIFLAKYGAKSSVPRYSEIVNSAMSMKQNLADEKVARVDWANIQRSSKIEDFMDFIKLHPASQLRNKAEARMEELKDPLLNDIRLRPFKYSRLEMSKYISSGILSREDLVGRGIISDDTFHHIITYPSLDLERNATMPYCPEIPTDTPGNTDVFFFGVPGSGKSCVLGALLALDGKSGFSFDPAGPGGAGFYAMELQRYVMNSLLPAATDLIAPPQLIDASISSINKNGLEETHRLSIIDMPGEKTARFAELDEASVCFDDLGEGVAELFNNENQKLLFFVIDPNNSLGVVLNNRNVAVSQVNVLNRVASLLEKSPELMKKVLAIHIILTKSDTIGDNIDGERLSSIFREQNYDAVLGRLNRLCRKYNVNARIDGDNSVHVSPFCLGKFGPGETYKFNGTAAQYLLQVIKNYTGFFVEPSFWDIVIKWFNN